MAITKHFKSKNEAYIRSNPMDSVWIKFYVNFTMSATFGMILTMTNFSDAIQLCSFIYCFVGLWSFLFHEPENIAHFFKCKWAKSSMELKWQKLINPNIESSSNQH